LPRKIWGGGIPCWGKKKSSGVGDKNRAANKPTKLGTPTPWDSKAKKIKEGSREKRKTKTSTSTVTKRDTKSSKLKTGSGTREKKKIKEWGKISESAVEIPIWCQRRGRVC